MMRITKYLSFTLLFCTSLTFSQSIEIGVGINGNFNGLTADTNYRLISNDVNGDSIFINFEQVNMDFSYTLPIFFRYRSKFGLWAELNLTREKLTIHSYGTSNYSDGFITTYTDNQILQDYVNDPALQATFPVFQDFKDAHYSQYKTRSTEYLKEELSFKEITQFNTVNINCGYTFLRTKKFRPYVSGGFSWIWRSNKNYYQSLLFHSKYVNDYSLIFEQLPRTNQHVFFIHLGAGLELFNMQLGVNIRQSVGRVQDVSTDSQNQQLFKAVTSFSAYLKYSLFNFNVRNSEDRIKLKKEEQKVLGDFVERNKLIKLNIGAMVSIFSNIQSIYEKEKPTDKHYVNGDSGFYLTENVFLKNYRIESGSDSSGVFRTDTAFTEIGFGRIKQINMFPKLFFGFEIEPLKFLSFETNLSYQYSQYDTEAKIIQYAYNWDEGYGRTIKRDAVYRQTFSTLSLGQKVNFKFNVFRYFYIGFNAGINLNTSIPGKFKQEVLGYNSDPLFRAFDQYLVEEENAKNWNNSSGNLNGDDQYIYEYYDQDSKTYTPLNDQRMNNFKTRFWVTWTIGFDMYYDRLRITPFMEGKITDLNFLYRDFFTAGIGLSYYLRK